MKFQLENLSKQNSGKWLFRDISFSVRSGEIFGLLAGDSEHLTNLLRAISGIDKSDSGSIRFNGRIIRNGRKEGITYKSEESTSRRLGLFSSGTAQNRTVSHFEMIRDSLSAASSVLLVENPIQSLDVNTTASISESIRRTTREKGLCTVIATNDPQEVFDLCDRVAVINKGMIVQTGTPEEIYLRPETTAAASVFGRINLISAKRTSSNKEAVPEFFTVTGEHRLTTAKTHKSELGPINQTIVLAIRPEHISISSGASFPDDNLIKARVESIEFRGPTTSIILDANDLKLRAVVLRSVGLNIGQECIVGLPPERIRILTN